MEKHFRKKEQEIIHRIKRNIPLLVFASVILICSQFTPKSYTLSAWAFILSGFMILVAAAANILIPEENKDNFDRGCVLVLIYSSVIIFLITGIATLIITFIGGQ